MNNGTYEESIRFEFSSLDLIPRAWGPDWLNWAPYRRYRSIEDPETMSRAVCTHQAVRCVPGRTYNQYWCRMCGRLLAEV